MESGISKSDRKYFLIDNFCSIEPIFERSFERGNFQNFLKYKHYKGLIQIFRIT